MSTRTGTGSRSLTRPLVLLLALTAFPIWAFRQMEGDHQIADDAAEQWRECCRLAEHIKTLQSKPVQAAAGLQTATQLARAVEEAAQAATIPLEQLVRIDPRSARRIENTPYREQLTRIELRDVTLHQLVSFLVRTARDNSGTEVAEIRLNAPRAVDAGDPPGEFWNAEVTLTSLIYIP